ncbi:MAG: hypothetical protein ACR2LN_06500 [Candidatus Levyibacteriota bacterium]
MKNVNKSLIILTALLLAFFLFPSKTFANTVLFHDDFNDNDISDWQVAQNSQIDNPFQPCLYNGTKANWQVVDGRTGININGPACITFMTPSSFKLPDNINYRYSVDVVDGIIHFVHKYIEPVQEFLRATKKQRTGYY